MNKVKLLRITTVPVSLKTLLKGQHRFMSSKGFEVIGVSSEGIELKEVHEQERIRVEALEMTRTISPLKDVKALWRFYKLCKKEKPVIVHSHTPKAGIVGMLGAKLAGVPIRLHTVAGMPLMEVNGLKRKVLDFVEKLTYTSATKVYPNSKGLYDFILENKYTYTNKLKLIANGSSNGIDTDFFAPEQVSADKQEQLKKELKINSEDFVFVFVGRLVGDKGINELVEAFQYLEISKFEQVNDAEDSKNDFEKVPNYQSQFARTKLLLVGPLESDLDPLKPETLKAIETNPNIISVGFQKDVRSYFAISDALVFPSYREGFPNVVMQAGAMGLPSIVSDINGCNEIIIDGENGIIIPVKNSKALLQAMEKLISNQNYYSKLQSNTRQMIQIRYEQKVVWEGLLREYNVLLNQI